VQPPFGVQIKVRQQARQPGCEHCLTGYLRFLVLRS
jgi:hypothetical protein